MDRSSPRASISPEPTERPELTGEQEAAVFIAACRRVTAAVRRERTASSRESLGDAADAPVYGAFVTLRREGRLRSCCGCVGKTMPLAEAVDHAADRAATDDPRFPPITPGEIRHLHVDVWILWGPEPIAERGEKRVEAITIGRHGLQIGRGHARGLLLPGVAVDHGFDARTFLEQVCIKAGLPTDAWMDDDVELMRFEGRAIEGNMETRPIGDRPPAVAGMFYPADPDEMNRQLDDLFAGAAAGLSSSAVSDEGENSAGQAGSDTQTRPYSGALVPHAGWIYSGRLAAAVLSRVELPEQAIVLCPKHRPGGARWAVAPHRRWLFPGGGLDSDPVLAERLAEGVPGLELDAAAHRDEHAVEVQLPLLARLKPDLRVVGIIVGDAALPELLGFGVAMSVVLRDMPRRPLLIVSSDMNHFADDARTRQLDRLAVEAIETLDPERVYETVRRNRITMCGMPVCVAAMEALRWMNSLNRCRSVGYATSAEAGGPAERVVGYAGLLFE
ncbi:MAG: AmmeMemoRadiSam system protein B [Pirellulales bacterium]|nr:AmmeMemoRadiSam system protein B [Pirellulales bacterium]